MTTTPFDPIFRESCVDVNKGECATDTRLIDPCSCTKYFRCVNNVMIPISCAAGTAFDHTVVGGSSCKTANDIFLQKICTPLTPWTRCKTTSNVTDSQLSQIKARCTGTIVTTPQPGDTNSNVGAIVGGILAGTFVIVLLIIGFIFYKRGYSPSLSLKKKEIKSKHPLHNQSSVNNPQYFGSQTNCPIYEEYSTIDDALHDPHHVQNVPSLPDRPSSAQSYPTGTGERKLSVTSVQTYMEPSPSQVYGFDNRGLDISEEHIQNGYINADQCYTEILPDISPNRHINLHNQVEDASPYDNTLHV